MANFLDYSTRTYHIVTQTYHVVKIYTFSVRPAEKYIGTLRFIRSQ